VGLGRSASYKVCRSFQLLFYSDTLGSTFSTGTCSGDHCPARWLQQVSCSWGKRVLTMSLCSVVGERGPGSAFGNNEYVVYRTEQVRPYSCRD
jgi:hypothetical protein